MKPAIRPCKGKYQEYQQYYGTYLSQMKNFRKYKHCLPE